MTVNLIQSRRVAQDLNLTESTRISELRRALLQYCRQLTLTDADAEDLVQDVLLKALPVVAGTYTHPNETAYLLRTAKHVWIDAYRKRNCTVTSIEASEAHLTFTMDLLLQLEVSEAIALMVHLLTPKECTTLLLLDVFGYAARETAQLLQSTEGAVKAGLRRARRKLKAYHESNTNEVLEAVSLDDDEQQLLHAYLAAFNHYDAAAVIHLARADVLDPVHALVQIVIRAHHPYNSRLSGRPESMATYQAASSQAASSQAA